VAEGLVPLAASCVAPSVCGEELIAFFGRALPRAPGEVRLCRTCSAKIFELIDVCETVVEEERTEVNWEG
jgi:hypothetical protein